MIQKRESERNVDLKRISLFTQDISEYLRCDAVIDHPSVSKLADQLYGEAENETDFIRKAYEYVRDRISHSADAGVESVTCSASEVLKAGHGICFAKSHLLAAILRSKSVPTGFCFLLKRHQKNRLIHRPQNLSEAQCTHHLSCCHQSSQ